MEILFWPIRNTFHQNSVSALDTGSGQIETGILGVYGHQITGGQELADPVSVIAGGDVLGIFDWIPLDFMTGWMMGRFCPLPPAGIPDQAVFEKNPGPMGTMVDAWAKATMASRSKPDFSVVMMRLRATVGWKSGEKGLGWVSVI